MLVETLPSGDASEVVQGIFQNFHHLQVPEIIALLDAERLLGLGRCVERGRIRILAMQVMLGTT